MSDPGPNKDGIIPPSGLVEGFIFPQRSLFSNLLFKHKKINAHQHSNAQHFPDFVRVQIGTRSALEEWLRSAGPGSILLWVQVPDGPTDASAPGVTQRLLKSQLQLAYRLRSFTVSLQPVFPGVHIVASPHAENSTSDKENFIDHSIGTPVCGKWHSLRQREKEKFLKSIGVSHLGNDFCVLQGQDLQRSQSPRVKRWFLALPMLLYEQLVQMISPGGILWHFQLLVKKLVHISVFMDVRFELIDFETWLKDHTYAAILEGSQFLVCLSTLQWTVVKFDFSANILKIAGDRCIESLHQFWCQNIIVNRERGENSGNISTESIENGNIWKLWELSKGKDNLECASFLDALYKKGGFSEQEAVSGFKQDFSFLNDFKMENIFSAPRSQELCVHSFSSRTKLSSKERCALSNLSSTNRTVRQRGTHILLDILLHDGKDKLFSGRSDSRASSSNRKGILTPISMKSLCSTYNMKINGSTRTSGDLSSNESCRVQPGMEKGETYKGRCSMWQQPQQNSVSQNMYQNEASSWKCFSCQNDGRDDPTEFPVNCSYRENTKGSDYVASTNVFEALCPNSTEYSSPFDDDCNWKLESIQMKLLEWISSFFLESLIEEAIVSPGKTIIRGETALSIEDTAEICLKATEILPADASSGIVAALMNWLKSHTTTDNSLLQYTVNGEIMFQEYQLDSKSQNLEIALQKVWCLSKLLAALVSGSVFVASGVARCGGLGAILKLYMSLVKLRISTQFEPAVSNDSFNKVDILPGGVVEQTGTNLVISPLLTNQYCNAKRRSEVGHSASQIVPSISEQIMQQDIQGGRKCKVLGGNISVMLDSVLNTISLCIRKRLPAVRKFVFSQMNGKSQLPQVKNPVKSDIEECTTEQKKVQSDNLDVDNAVVHHVVSALERPKVPNLMLAPRLMFEKDRRLQGLNLNHVEYSFFAKESISDPSYLRSMSKTSHKFQAMIVQAKICLLEVFHTLLLHRSAAAISAQKEVVEEICMNKDIIISSFITDLFNCFDSFSQSDTISLKEHIFKVIYQLDDLLNKIILKNLSQHVHGDKDHCLELPNSMKQLLHDFGSGFNGWFLRVASENLNVALSDVNLESNSGKDFNLKLVSHNNHAHGPVQMSDLSILQRISTLMGVIADYTTFLSEKGISCQDSLDMCGYINEALRFFSGLGDPDTWTLPQILAMQSLLNLLKGTFQEMKDRKSSSPIWTDSDENIWQVIVQNNKHWTCVKNYLSWLLTESCHGCKKNLLNYWKFYPDMPEALAILLFSKPDFCLESPGFGCLRDAFHCLGTLVFLSHRRMQAKVPDIRGGLLPFTPEDQSFLSDFLLNPVDGLLMNILKGPFFHGKMIHTDREMERDTLNCTRVPEEPMPLFQARHECDISPSLKLSSTRQSATSIIDINSTQFLTEKEFLPFQRDPLWKYGTLPSRNRSWQKSSPFKILKQLNPALNCNQKFLDVESPGFSVHSHFSYVHCPCRSCTIKVITQGLSSHISLLIEEECLNLLVHIFSLKFIECTMRLEVRYENPFLRPRYVDAFLDYQFLSFLQLYNWKTDGPQKNMLTSHPSVKNTDFSCRISDRNEETPSIQESSSLEDLSSAFFAEDEIITFACRKHGEVLLALSCNKDENVSDRFKQLKVMDFLIHQIALEYESSHLVTPRDSFRENNLHEVLSPQDRSCAYDDISYRDKNMTVPESVSNAGNETIFTDGVRHGDALNVDVGDSRARICSPVSARNYNHSRSNHQRTSKYFKQKTIYHQPRYFSCRTCRNKRNNFPIVSRGQSYLFGIQSHQRGLRYGKHSKLPVVTHCLPKASSDNRRTMKRQKLKGTAFSPRSYRNNATSLDQDCHDISVVYDEITVVGTLTSMVSPSKTIQDSSCDCSTGSVDREHEDSNSNRFKSINKFIYSGRFCDLNEEVEKALAQENLSITNCYSDRGRSSLQKSEMSKQKNCRSVIYGNEKPSKTVSSAKRPLVPKLTLPKSARKGDEDLSSLRGSLEEDAFEKKRSQAPLSPEADDSKKSEFNSGEIYSEDVRKTVILSYEIERMKRRIYRDSKLHVLVLELFVSLMITPQGSLDTSYTDRFPIEGQKMNAPFYLIYHINHAANAELLPLLRQRMKSLSPSMCRIFKLVCRDLFNSSLYTNKHRIAHGAFAQVYTATFTKMDGDKKLCQSVVLKTVDLPKGPHEPCKFFDIYSEVEILEKFIGDNRVCQLLDYGVDVESFVLVLKQYKCSLRHWRQQFDVSERDATEQFGQAFYVRLPLYLEIYSAVLQAVKVLELHNVVHYDLKCDNILLEPLENLQSEEEFWNPVSPNMVESFHLPFRVCIADFGQSKASILQGGECTVRNRGTEYVKSPEMLKLLSINKQNENLMCPPVNDETVGRAVDIWGLGCLLYELLTGDYLLYDEDWTRFFIRVTLPSEELITHEKAAKLNNFKPIMEFLNFILVRDPQQRPTLDAVIQKLEQLQTVLRRDGIGYGCRFSRTEDKIEVAGSNSEKHTELTAALPQGEGQIDRCTLESTRLCDYRVDPRTVLSDPSTWKTNFIRKLICGG